MGWLSLVCAREAVWASVMTGILLARAGSRDGYPARSSRLAAAGCLGSPPCPALVLALDGASLLSSLSWTEGGQDALCAPGPVESLRIRLAVGVAAGHRAVANRCVRRRAQRLAVLSSTGGQRRPVRACGAVVVGVDVGPAPKPTAPAATPAPCPATTNHPLILATNRTPNRIRPAAMVLSMARPFVTAAPRLHRARSRPPARRPRLPQPPSAATP